MSYCIFVLFLAFGSSFSASCSASSSCCFCCGDEFSSSFRRYFLLRTWPSSSSTRVSSFNWSHSEPSKFLYSILCSIWDILSSWQYEFVCELFSFSMVVVLRIQFQRTSILCVIAKQSAPDIFTTSPFHPVPLILLVAVRLVLLLHLFHLLLKSLFLPEDVELCFRLLFHLFQFCHHPVLFLVLLMFRTWWICSVGSRQYMLLFPVWLLFSFL